MVMPFDYKHLATMRSRALGSASDFMFLRRAAQSRLLDRLYDVRRSFADMLEIGSFDGSLAAGLLAMSPAKHQENYKLYQVDIDQRMAKFASDQAIFKSVFNAELPQFQEDQAAPQYDLIFSSLFFQWVNDLPGLLSQCRQSLRPDGLLIANFFGGRTLQELRTCLTHAETEISGGAYPRCIPMVDVKGAGALLQRAGFALPVSDSDLLKVTYASLNDLMIDLRKMGETNALSARCKRFSSRALFARAAELYQDNFADDNGQLVASFELVTITAWAPDASQQKPLRPGSANHSLAAAVMPDKNGN